uniref:NADH-ubiquinone oxidoreductase chain 1 n=1 Tax=Pselaphinae sp. 10 EF-2015 TaxID=1756854 RepID=A0A0S2M8V5_9COLE|nr:NADH deshydrogenase subunit 1 [Pselaphinae sp. 10 EF-2015]
MMLIISLIILLVMVLIAVAFLTLLERKVLGYIQIRKGPNKVGVLGILQPFSDAIKLFSKEGIYPFMSNYFMYYICPILNLFISLMMWMSLPMITEFFSFSLSLMFFFCCSSLSVYSIMMAGWSSNSNYSMLGSVRSIVQTISYEVSLILIILSFLLLINSMKLIDFMLNQYYLWFIFLYFPLSLALFISSLAETNRTPFDFAEGESELVSGFNVEYSSGGFAMIFLAEYSSILFMSFLLSLMFLGGNIYSIMFFFKVVFMSFLWVWVRGTLPRFRYDKLMYLSWKSFLPLSLNFLFFYLSLSMLIFIINI